MATNWPTITIDKVEALWDGWEEGVANNPTVESRTEGGYRVTRPRYTRIPKLYKFSYPYLSSSDKAKLETFEKTVQVGAGLINWTPYTESASKVVRLKSPIKYRPNKGTSYWIIDVELEEV